MKKQYYLYSILALSLIIALPVTIHAQEDPSQGPDSNPPPGQQTPPPFSGLPQAISDQVQAEYQARIQNVHDNQNYRNAMLEGQPGSGTPPFMGGPDASSTDASSTGGRPPFPPGMYGRPRFGSTTPDRFGSSTRPWNGTSTPPRFSSTTMEEFMHGDASSTDDYQRGVSQEVHLRVFKMQQDHLVQQLTTALDNLKEIRTRIVVRIQLEEASGTDMTGANTLLATADAKISVADAAIQALASLSPSATSTATTTIDLGKPRQMGSDAIKAVDDAQKALGDVVQAIIKAMGINFGSFGDRNDSGHSTSSPPFSTSTPPVTSTTTASTTSQ